MVNSLKIVADIKKGVTFTMRSINNAPFMEAVLISLVRENKAESKAVVIGAMVSFLMESFSFMSENQALIIATKTYAKA